MKKWRCTVCGYVHTGDAPPDKCPVCGADKSLFEEVAEPGPAKVSTRKWKCSVCGYTHTGDAPPDKCPVCGADKSLFEEVAEKPGPEVPAAGATTADPAQDPSPAATPEASGDAPPAGLAGRFFGWIAAQILKHHLHPISVHFPNGILPMVIVFLAAAVFTGFGELTIAMFYSLAFTLLTLPLVIFTGFVEWRKHYGGNLTSMFLIKMGAAAVVFVTVFILTLWLALNPDVLDSGMKWVFVLTALVMIGAAAIAGLIGGKLVFKD